VVNEKFGIRLTDVVSATERMEQPGDESRRARIPLSVGSVAQLTLSLARSWR